MDYRLFKAADSRPRALCSMLCGIVLFVAPGAAAASSSSTQQVREEIGEGAARHVELLGQLEALGEFKSEAETLPQGSQLQASTLLDPRRAPPMPRVRGHPAKEAMDVSPSPGRLGDEVLMLLQRRVDADGDGHYEETHFVSPDGGEVLRKHIDRNRDGRVDCWRKLRAGKIVAQVLDTNFNGRPEIWEQYMGGQTVTRQIDHDEDGVRDVFFHYEEEILVMEEHDEDGDGSIDIRSFYEDGQLVRREILTLETF